MYCIMRTEKRKKSDLGGIQKENLRTATEYNNRVSPDMNIFNVTLRESDDWLRDINNEIKAAGAKPRANSVLALDTLYTASPEFFQGKANEENDQFFRDCLKFHNDHFGHIVSAVVHYDETTPHLHVISVPLTQDGRLSARDVIGNKARMSKTQDAFFEQVGKGYGLERGIHMDGQEKKEHISAQEWQLRQVKQEKAKELEELEAIKRSKTHARARAQKARQRAIEQENRNIQAESDKRRLQREYEVQKGNLQDVKAEYEHLREQVEQVQGFLTTAEQRQLEELQEQVEEDFEL